MLVWNDERSRRLGRGRQIHLHTVDGSRREGATSIFIGGTGSTPVGSVRPLASVFVIFTAALMDIEVNCVFNSGKVEPISTKLAF